MQSPEDKYGTFTRQIRDIYGTFIGQIWDIYGTNTGHLTYLFVLFYEMRNND